METCVHSAAGQANIVKVLVRPVRVERDISCKNASDVWTSAATAPADGWSGDQGRGPGGAEQALQYAVWDVAVQSEVQRGRLPLTSGSRLSWLAFSDEGLLSAMDSSGWGPVFCLRSRGDSARGDSQGGFYTPWFCCRGCWLPEVAARRLVVGWENWNVCSAVSRDSPCLCSGAPPSLYVQRHTGSRETRHGVYLFAQSLARGNAFVRRSSLSGMAVAWDPR